jgi:hypothetical protein
VKPGQELSTALLAGAGFRLVGTTLAGLLFGIVLFKYTHWAWAAPVGILLGFLGGLAAMYRDLARAMR